MNPCTFHVQRIVRAQHQDRGAEKLDEQGKNEQTRIHSPNHVSLRYGLFENDDVQTVAKSRAYFCHTREKAYAVLETEGMKRETDDKVVKHKSDAFILVMLHTIVCCCNV